MRKLSVKMNPRHLATTKRQQLEGKEAARIKNRDNTCKRNLELVMKSRLEYPNRSTYSCRPGKSSQNQLYVKYHNIDKMAQSPQKTETWQYCKCSPLEVMWKISSGKNKKKKKKERKWYEQVPDSSSETMKWDYCGIGTSNVTKSLKLEQTLWLLKTDLERSVPLSILLYQGIRELVKRRMRSFTTIRTLKRNIYRYRSL